MAFNKGIFDASPIEQAPCGLLSVARVTSWESDDEQWLRGYNYRVIGSPAINLLTASDSDTVTGGDVSTDTSKPIYLPGSGFTIVTKRTITLQNLSWEDPEAVARDIALAATQKAVELEFWEGPAAQVDGHDTAFLRKSGGATVLTTAAVSVDTALHLLEQSISNSPVGARGVIHMTRDVASELGSRILYKGDGDSATEDRAITRQGTRVVIGSGYTGNGPIGSSGAAASATNKWMYSTTTDIAVDLGQIDTVVSIKQSPVTATNDGQVILQRSASVRFDTSVWYAAQVTLPTT